MIQHTLAAEARQVATAHLDRLDSAVPGLVTGLHVVGSATLGDYHPGMSDLDLVAELARDADDDDLAAIAEAHQGDGHPVETVYLASGSLAGTPDEVGAAPWVREGEAHANRSDALHAITWLELARHSATLRGDRPAMTEDLPAAVAYCRANLVSYWQPLLDRTAEALAERGPTGSVRPYGALWIALGPARLWHTIRSGEVVGKSRAGELAAERWPDLAGPLLELVALRAGAPIEVTTSHGLAAVEVGRRVLADARQH